MSTELVEGQVIDLGNGVKRRVLMSGRARTPEQEADLDELRGMLREQAAAEARQAGPVGVWDAPRPAPARAAPRPSPPATGAGGIFDPATDLTEDAEHAFRWYPMPGGKRVCVHAPTPADAERIGRAVVRDLTRMSLFRETTDPAEQEALRIERTYAATARQEVWTVFACARQGEDPNSPRVFDEQSIEKLQKSKRWGPVIGEIAGIVQALEASQETEAGRLREWLTDFFAQDRSWHEMLCATLREGRTAEARAALERRAGLVSAWKPPAEPWDFLNSLTGLEGWE